MSRPFILYHWSPVARRKSILRSGLVPCKPSRCGQWRPPYLCFADSPSLAWALSAGMKKEPGEWDLWMCWSTAAGKLKRLSNPVRGATYKRPTEWRTKDRVFKRHLWHVGTRKR